MNLLNNNYKCIAIIINNKFLLNVISSKIIIDLPYILVQNKNKYIQSFKDTLLFLMQFSKNINDKYNYKPNIIQFSDSKSSKRG